MEKMEKWEKWKKWKKWKKWENGKNTDTDIILPTLTPSRCASLLITEHMLTKLVMDLHLPKGT